MCEQHQLISDSEFSFAVLGRDGQFTLFDLNEPLDQREMFAAVAKGESFCGVVGFKDGLILTSHEPDPEAWRVVIEASRAVARIVGERLQAEACSAMWLTTLYNLPDHRSPITVSVKG